MALSEDDLQQRFYDGLFASEHWPRERIIEHQRSQLEQLLNHARTQVPFYQNRLDAVFKPGGGIDWERWRDIPLLTRDDLVAHADAMRARTMPPGHGHLYTATTSGSTGKPVTTVHNGLANLASRATGFRSHRRHGIDWSATLAYWRGDALAPDGRSVGQVGGPWGPRWHPDGARGRAIRVSRRHDARTALRFFADNDARYFSGRGKTAQAMALEAMRLQLPNRFDEILCFATGIEPDEREDCKAAFGARMIGMYSSKEGQQMAHQCPSGTHYHVDEEVVLLEIIDADGNPTPPGETGRVVVTPLFSTAQPLIRYEHGDLAIPGTTCPCGRTLMVLERIVGRTMHLFRFPDGSTSSPTLPGTATGLIGARHIQLAQVAPLRIEARYVPRDDTEPDADAIAELIAAVRRVTHRDAEITLSRRLTLERGDGGKFMSSVYEVPESAS